MWAKEDKNTFGKKYHLPKQKCICWDVKTTHKLDYCCGIDLSKDLWLLPAIPFTAKLAKPSRIHSVPPLFAFVSEGNSSRQTANVCVIYTRVELRLICILTWVLNVHLNLRGATVDSVRALMWESCGWYPRSNSHCSCFFVGESETASKWKARSLLLKPCNTRRGIALLSVDTTTNTHQYKQDF